MPMLLLCSVPTVRDDASNILAKLHVVDRAQEIVGAPEAGLGRRSGAAL